MDTHSLTLRPPRRENLEDILMQVVDEVKGSRGNIILFIDDAHKLFGSAPDSQAVDSFNIIKLALAKGELNVIDYILNLLSTYP